MADSKGAIYEFDGFRLNVGERLLTREGTPVAIPSKAFDLLVALVENNGHLVEKETLYNRIWAGQFVEDANLTVQISAIRKALGNGYIKTVKGHGYRFAADVRHGNGNELLFESETISRITIEREESTDASAVDDNRQRFVDGVSGASRPGWFRRLPYVAVAVGGIVILAGLGLGGFWPFSRSGNNAAAPAVLAEKQIDFKRLTSKGTVNRAVLSPDAKFFVYNISEKGSSRSSLWLGQTDGNSDLQLLPPADLYYNPRSFSVDGNWVYYTASLQRDFENATLYKMQVLGGVPQKLAQGVNIYTCPSPDEKRIAFISGDRKDKTSALVIADLDGSDKRELIARPPEQSIVSHSLAWSFDGKLIAFAAKNDGDNGLEIFSTNIENGEVKQITTLEWRGIPKLEWLADGSGLIAVARDRNDKNSFDSNQIWRIDYGTGRAQKVVNDLLHYGASLSLSADSNSMVVLQANLESNIWIAPSGDLAEARQITFGSSGQEGWYGMDWFADNKIVYVVRTDKSLTLWTMDPSGANAEQITSVGFLDDHPSGTADGKYIVFVSNRSGTSEIWRVQADGRDLRQLTFEGKSSHPQAMPDSKTIVYSRAVDGANYPWQMSIDGGESTQISNTECGNPRVSPDGKFIACGSRVENKTKLTIISIENRTPIRSFDVPPTYNFDYSIRWSRDGRFVSYRDWLNGIWSQSVDGGEPKRLEGLPAEKLYTYEWSPDGKQLAFTRGRQLRDAVLITGFK